MQIESRSWLGRIYQSDRRLSAYVILLLTGSLVAAVLPWKQTETRMPATIVG